MTHHHLESFAESVLRTGGDHDVSVVPDPGLGLVDGLLEVAELLQEAGMAVSGQILEGGGEVGAGELDGGGVRDTDRDVGEGEHGGVGEAAGEGDHLLGGRRQDPRHLPDQGRLAGRGDLIYKPRVNHFHFISL